MNLRFLQGILFLGLSFCFLKAGAQKTTPATDSLSKQRTHLQEITIQGNRLQIPFSEENRDIVVLNSKEIQNLPVHSLNDLLNFVAGIDVRQRGPWGGQADISINGGTFDETLILLNGIKIIDPQTGHNMMNLPINPEDIERIEILKGPAASAYGINGMNGAINIVTKQPDKSHLRVSLSGGSSFQKDSSTNKLYGTLESQISGSLSGKNSRHYFSVSTLQSSGYRYNTAMENSKIYYQNQINLNNKDNYLQCMAGFVYNDMGTNGFYAPPGDKESKETIQTGIAALKGHFQPKKGWIIQPSLSYRYGADDYIFIRQNPSAYENIHFTNVVDAALNNTIQTRSGDVGIGIEYRSATINSNSLGDHERNNIGLFTEYRFTKIKPLVLHAGAYLNYNQSFGWQFLPSVDLGYQLNPYWRIFANAGTGTRLPTFTDLYYKGPANIGNSQLQPENALETELGIKFVQHDLHASLSYFYRNTSNFIDWVKDSLNAPWQSYNFQNIRTRGLSLTADYKILSPHTNEGLSLAGGISYTRLEPKIILPEGTKSHTYSHYALENLKNQFVIHLNVGFCKHFTASLTGTYEQRVNDKEYFLTDFGLKARFKPFEAGITLNNLGNITDIETGAVPLPGRWIRLSMSWQI